MYVWEQQCNNKNDEEGMQFSNGAVVTCALPGIFGCWWLLLQRYGCFLRLQLYHRTRKNDKGVLLCTRSTVEASYH